MRLLSENRFTRYLIYAVGEIILVVAGILIALQVNNWNETSRDRDRTMTLLSNLQNEIRQDSIYFENVFTVETDIFLVSAEILLKEHSGRSASDDDDQVIGRAFRYACFMPVIKYSDNAFRELVSSGLFEEVHSPGLKQALYEYYDQINFLNRYSDQNNNFTSDLIQELASYYEILPPDEDSPRLISSFSGAAEAEFYATYDLVSFRKNRSLNPKLYDIIDIHKDRLGGLIKVRELSRDILVGIDRELNPDHH